jgi:hypothetical protein
MKRTDLTNGIKPPKFRVGRFILNEYEAREMIARIAEGTLNPNGIVLTDMEGKTFTFDNTGTTEQFHRIKNWDLGSGFAIRKWKANRNIE